MNLLKVAAWIVLIVFLVVVILLFVLQTRLLFHPGRLSADYKFKLGSGAEEVFLKTSDGETLNGLLYAQKAPEVILYFHGNAGDLSGWQYVAEDFKHLAYNFFIFDYRGYGKSTGEISEKGIYLDAEACYRYLIHRGFDPGNIIIYGRSIGCGAAVDLASKQKCRGLILESAFSSLAALANEKMPLLFPSLYLRYRFDNNKKIRSVSCPVIFLHGSDDTLIPPSHSQKLFHAFPGKKEIIIVDKGSHNDLHAFERYEKFLRDELRVFFKME